MPGHEGIDLLRDLAIVLMVSGGVILLFHRLRQPVILGYIIAGLVIGPFTPPFPLVNEIEVINVLADLGIILLMFSLGLEFSLAKLRRVGKIALLGGGIQVVIVFILGYQLGMLFNWGTSNSLFLGAALSISSTALIVKVLEEQKRTSDHASQVVIGILVFEDFAAIAMIALLSGFGTAGSIQLDEVVPVILKLLLFAAVSILLGLSIVQRLMGYIYSVGNREMALIVGLALCFGMAFLSRSLGLSVASGAFIAGALVAEARRSEQLSHSILPIRDMFAALFFIAIGMLVDPAFLLDYWLHILVISFVLIAGKILAGTIASFILGFNRHAAIRVGMNLAQIGEFSLVIVKIGQETQAVSPFLYPIIVGVTAVSTLTTPYVIKASITSGEKLDRVTPLRLRRYLDSIERALQRVQTKAGEKSVHGDLIRRHITNILINLFLFLVVVSLGRAAYENRDAIAELVNIPSNLAVTAISGLIIVLSAFPLIALVYYIRSLADKGAEIIGAEMKGAFINTQLARNILRDAVSVVLLFAVVMVVNLFLPRVPSVPYLPFLNVGVVMVVALYLFWKSVSAYYQRVENLLRERLLGNDTTTEETHDKNTE